MTTVWLIGCIFGAALIYAGLYEYGYTDRVVVGLLLLVAGIAVEWFFGARLLGL